MSIRNDELRFNFVLFVILAVCSTFLAAACFAQQQLHPDTADEVSLKSFIQTFDKNENDETRYSFAFVDLKR